MDHIDYAIDADCAYIDGASLLKYTKKDFIDGILAIKGSGYTKSKLGALKKEDLLVLYCKLKNYKLVDHSKVKHFPGKVPPPPPTKKAVPANKPRSK